MPTLITDPTTALHQTQLLALAKHYQGPFWAYDAQIIRQQVAKLRQFDVIRFAQKSCSNTHILRLMREEGVKVDSVSVGELERALQAGFSPESDDIVFTADLLDTEGLARVRELNVAVNTGSIDMLKQLAEVSPGHRVWLRINPGFGHGHSQKTNTGGENSKHGIWYEQLPDALAVIHSAGLQLEGLHMHIGSGVDYQHLQQVCDAMVEQVLSSGCDLRAISAGGGLSTPYTFDDQEIDPAHYFSLWDHARHRIAEHLGHAITLEIEPGRFLVAQSGVLVSQVRGTKWMGSRHFTLVDAGFSDLMRPAMYGSYHHISVMAADSSDTTSRPVQATLVAGPLCESGDVFTQLAGGEVEPRTLPLAYVGDYLVFHDTGAYGASMSSNYNSRPLIPEVLIDNGHLTEIRRRQTVAELLALESARTLTL
ncbi:diaminopimelate decarboxylase [Rosenbergiella australiborealis]|uniref:Diaminopimelate decarboxylase n=1 Tax=Rosenbergiella australiborealis TaxID=1544696 RepID=A0ABS5T7I7_9GAMM|nr:diaminopimelate decarboxylase [Rosenbergiella australiborealis]MBT0728333.1 diaminopimelate decarboxylase [Rosenbergiella australiborealis]